jgi:hypothetical protein
LPISGPAPAVPATAPLTAAGAAAVGPFDPFSYFSGHDGGNVARSGGQFSAGYWFDDEHSLGVEASYFFLASRSVGFGAGSAAAADPSVLTTQVRKEVTAASTSPWDPDDDHHRHWDDDRDHDHHDHDHHDHDHDHHDHKHGDDKGWGDDRHHGRRDHDGPGDPPPATQTTVVMLTSRGTVASAFANTDQVVLTSRMQGAEANGVFNLAEGTGYRVDLVGGFRFLELVEGLDISQQGTYVVQAAGAGAVPAGVASTLVTTEVSRLDQFGTENHFYGSQLGARVELQHNQVFLSLLGKVALGCMHEQVAINGQTSTSATVATTLTDGITQTTPAARTQGPGLLAQAGNSGCYSRDCFAVVPEVTLRLGYEFNSHWRASAGYTFLFASEVVRPGDQIDPVLGAGHPAFSFHGTSFWAQGLDCGLEFRY